MENTCVSKADNLTTFMCRLLEILGASNFWNPKGLSRPVWGLLYLPLHIQGKICSKFSVYISIYDTPITSVCPLQVPASKFLY